MIKNFIFQNGTVSLFILIFILDMYLLGGGRVIEVFGVTLRMILFPMALLLAFIVLINRRVISFTVLWCYLLFILALLYSSLISAIDGVFYIKSITVYFFVFLILFFYYFRNHAYYFIEGTIAFSSVFMSICYLVFMVTVGIGQISILDIYNFIPKSEVFLRGEEGFVYKGFLYILIGALYFFIVDKYKLIWRVIFFLLCFTAILGTLTRGFFISLLVVMFIYSVVNHKSLFIKIIAVFIAFLIPVIFVCFYPEFIFRAGSDSTRVNDIYVFLDFINSGNINILFGNGISTFIGDRSSVENSYMDIWFRFGFFGLFLLLICMLKISIDYRHVRKLSVSVKHYDWLYYSVILIFVQSNFNPYINNYIGGSFLMFVLVYFDSERMKISNISLNNARYK